MTARVLLWSVKHGPRTVHRLVTIALGSDFYATEIGTDLSLPHPYGLVIHSQTRIGDRVRIYQHATIGAHHSRGAGAIVGDDVTIGAGAVILGPIRIGNGATIGANAVVTRNVPAGATVAGVPARLVSK